MEEEIEALKKRLHIVLFRSDLIDLLEKACIAFAAGSIVHWLVEGDVAVKVEPEDIPGLFGWLRQMNEDNWN